MNFVLPLTESWVGIGVRSDFWPVGGADDPRVHRSSASRFSRGARGCQFRHHCQADAGDECLAPMMPYVLGFLRRGAVRGKRRAKAPIPWFVLGASRWFWALHRPPWVAGAFSNPAAGVNPVPTAMALDRDGAGNPTCAKLAGSGATSGLLLGAGAWRSLSWGISLGLIILTGAADDHSISYAFFCGHGRNDEHTRPARSFAAVLIFGGVKQASKASLRIVSRQVLTKLAL